MELLNKPPHWNESLHCWCLNFRGRVKLASVKNFQLIAAGDPEKAIVMQARAGCESCVLSPAGMRSMCMRIRMLRQVEPYTPMP